MANFDDMKLAVEALSGGKNTVLFDDMGMPSIVFPFAKQKYSDLMAGSPSAGRAWIEIRGGRSTNCRPTIPARNIASRIRVKTFSTDSAPSSSLSA